MDEGRFHEIIFRLHPIVIYDPTALRSSCAATYCCQTNRPRALIRVLVRAWCNGNVLLLRNELVKVYFDKCIPVILYGLEACPLTKSDLLSMDFVINRILMKLFRTSNINIVKYCQECFSFDVPSDLWRKRVTNFEAFQGERCSRNL